MKTSFELLRELLLLERQPYPAPELYRAIKLAIHSYCEQYNINEEQFIRRLKFVYSVVWDDYTKDNYNKKYAEYSILLLWLHNYDFPTKK